MAQSLVPSRSPISAADAGVLRKSSKPFPGTLCLCCEQEMPAPSHTGEGPRAQLAWPPCHGAPAGPHPVQTGPSLLPWSQRARRLAGAGEGGALPSNGTCAQLPQARCPLRLAPSFATTLLGHLRSSDCQRGLGAYTGVPGRLRGWDSGGKNYNFYFH